MPCGHQQKQPCFRATEHVRSRTLAGCVEAQEPIAANPPTRYATSVTAPPTDFSSSPRAQLTEALVSTGEQDREAFARVYAMTSAKLFGICLRICGNRQAAEDVLQDVYLSIWKRAAGYEPGRSSPITWLATIARNRAIDWRRANRHHDAAAPAEEAPEPIDEAPLASQTMMQDEAVGHLRRCLEELEGRQQEAIRTAFFEGLSYTELAERRSVPLGTMKSWIRRGLMRLKECLGDAR
jgi:RNA polymerase sigma factor (sigma-70 family)